MKILHAAKYYPPFAGGMETALQQLCAGLADEWDTTVVAANDARGTLRERCDNVSIVRASSWGRAASVPLCPTQPFHLWRGRYDCLVLHEPNPLAALALLCRVPARTLIVWHHSDVVRPGWARVIYPSVQQLLYRRAQCVIVSSEPLGRYSRAVRVARRVAVIPFGVPLNGAVPPPERVREMRARYRGPLTLFVGRLVYYKGLELLVQAMFACPGTLLVAGAGPLEASLRALVAQLGLGERVVFLGRISNEDLRTCYAASDVFVLPSTDASEAFGIVQIEAMAAGLPVISTDLPTGVPWVNQHEITGLIVPPGDLTALAAALNRLHADGHLRSRLGGAGRLRAETEFSSSRMVQKFRQLLIDVVGTPSPGCVRMHVTGT